MLQFGAANIGASLTYIYDLQDVAIKFQERV